MLRTDGRTYRRMDEETSQLKYKVRGLAGPEASRPAGSLVHLFKAGLLLIDLSNVRKLYLSLRQVVRFTGAF